MSGTFAKRSKICTVGILRFACTIFKSTFKPPLLNEDIRTTVNLIQIQTLNLSLKE